MIPREMQEPSGASLVRAQQRAAQVGIFKAPAAPGDTTLVDARLSDLRAQRGAIEKAIEALELERALITGVEPEFVRDGAR